MAFQEYCPSKVHSDVWKDRVVVSNEYLRLGKDFWHSLGEPERVRLFFDCEEKQIGIQPTVDESKGLKIQLTKGKNPRIRWMTFLKWFALHFDKPKYCSVVNFNDPSDKIKIISILK